MTDIQRICTGPCGRTLILDNFSNHAHGKYGKQPRCRDCVRAQNKVWRKNNREKANACSIRYQKLHPEVHRKEAREYARRNTEKQWAYQIKSQYGITAEQYYELLTKQFGKCAICSKIPKTKMHVDHNHETGKTRGILCGNCNRGLGIFKEDRHRLIKAIEYLTFYK